METQAQIFTPKQHYLEVGETVLDYSNRFNCTPQDVYLGEKATGNGLNAFAYLFRRFGTSINISKANFLGTYIIDTPNKHVKVLLALGEDITFAVIMNSVMVDTYVASLNQPIFEWIDNLFGYMEKEKGVLPYDYQMTLSGRYAERIKPYLLSDLTAFVESLPNSSELIESAKKVGEKDLINALYGVIGDTLKENFFQKRADYANELINDYAKENPHPLFIEGKTLFECMESIHSSEFIQIHNAIAETIKELEKVVNIDGVGFNLYGKVEVSEETLGVPLWKNTGLPFIENYIERKDYKRFMEIMYLALDTKIGLVETLNKFCLPLRNAFVNKKSNTSKKGGKAAKK
jgi:hypothetical protein